MTSLLHDILVAFLYPRAVPHAVVLVMVLRRHRTWAPSHRLLTLYTLGNMFRQGVAIFRSFGIVFILQTLHSQLYGVSRWLGILP